MSSRTLIAVAMWVGLAAGCVSTKIRSVQSFVDFPVAGAVLVADTYSWRLVALSGHRVDRVDDGRLSIEVRLKNLSGLDLPVEIKTVFHGADGVVVSQDADCGHSRQ